jgi:DNA (cytosine-5)-methyltransferase 1
MKTSGTNSKLTRRTRPVKVGVLDFFCGCGGTSSGFTQAKVDGAEINIIAGVDIDPHWGATYERMIGAPAEQLDIRELANDSSLFRAKVRSWRLRDYDKLILLGCAPCQGFAAHRKSVDGEDNRRHLFVEFCRLATRLKPDAIFMENVPDLFSKSYWPYYSEGRAALEESRYCVRSRVYNFAGFGLPQERFRAVMLAFRHIFPMPEPFLEPATFRTVRDAISHLEPLASGQRSETDEMHIVSKHRADTIAILAQVPRDGGNRPVGVGPACLDRARLEHGGYTDVYGRLAWDRPAVTVTARCRTPSCGRFAHPEQNRGLSVREASLLQGFPPDYIFEGPFDDKYKQIGNAVSPLVAKHFAEHIVGVLMGRRNATASSTDVSKDILSHVGPGFAVTINGIKRSRTA